MNGWKLVVWGMLPPPLVLTALLVVPMPRVVGRGLLAFARSFLFCPVLGGILLVHLMLLLTAMMMIGEPRRLHSYRKLRPDHVRHTCMYASHAYPGRCVHFK